jgi:FtsP/CotA-like multicopper oxidase with cupredoxin domain
VTLWSDLLQTNPALISSQTRVLGGVVSPPEAAEAGWKDTVIAQPGEITRVNSTFDIAGLYVWHCHIVEHEDNGMRVPCVGDKASAPGCSVVP